MLVYQILNLRTNNSTASCERSLLRLTTILWADMTWLRMLALNNHGPTTRSFGCPKSWGSPNESSVSSWFVPIKMTSIIVLIAYPMLSLCRNYVYIYICVISMFRFFFIPHVRQSHKIVFLFGSLFIPFQMFQRIRPIFVMFCKTTSLT